MTPDMRSRVEAELRREGWIPEGATPEQVAMTLKTARAAVVAFRLACGDLAVELTAALEKAREVARRVPWGKP